MSLESLYNDVVEAERQGKLTHEALNWLRGFKDRIKVLMDEKQLTDSAQFSGREEAWFCSICKHDKNHGKSCDSCGELRR